MLGAKQPGYLQELAQDHAVAIDLENKRLQAQAVDPEAEITSLTGNPWGDGVTPGDRQS